MPVCVYACVHVGIFMHLYKIPPDADKMHSKEGLMVFPPFVREMGKTFFSAYKCSLFLIQSLLNVLSHPN